MLLAPKIREEKLDQIPAVVHADNSGRVQTVAKGGNPVFYELIEEFSKITGIPILVNTSFNDNGEPIVETPLDSLICFMRTRIDYVCIDGLLVSKAEISDKEELLDRLVQHREKILQKSYEDGIRLICKDYDSQEMVEYLNGFYSMHTYHKHMWPYVRLQELIHAGGFEKVFTDGHHKELIERFLPEEWSMIKNKVEFLDDHYGNKDQITPNSLVILFNLSLYTPETSMSLYSDWSMNRMESMVDSQEAKSTKDDTGLDFSKSTEFKSSKDWEGFYRNILSLEKHVKSGRF